MISKILFSLFLLSINFFTILPNQNEIIANEKIDVNQNEKIDSENNQNQIVNTDQNEDNKENKFELLDQIVSEVTYLGSDSLDTNIITDQEVKRRGFDGNVYTVQDLENQSLADQFSKILKANITNDDINRNLKRNGMTEKDIINIADRWGYLNKDEFFEDLKKIYRANAALNYEVESSLVASHDDIKLYYEKHFHEYMQEAQYIVETAFVPFNIEQNENNESLNKEQIRNELETYIKSASKKPAYLNWDFPVEICQNEITKDNEFLIDLQINSMYMKEAPDGFILYKMKNKIPERITPLESVQQDIIVKLKKERYSDVVKKVMDKLRSQAIIIHPAC